MLNDLEQDRLDPRTLHDAETLLAALAKALDIDQDHLRELANEFEHAFAMQNALQTRLELEAVAFRARTEKG